MINDHQSPLLGGKKKKAKFQDNANSETGVLEAAGIFFKSFTNTISTLDRSFHSI